MIKQKHGYESVIEAGKSTEDISVVKDETNISQNDVKIQVTMPENKYTLKLPDGTVTNTSTIYNVSKNGVYAFEFTDKNGYKNTQTVHVTNIQNRKETKVPEVIALQGKIKLVSEDKIEYSLDKQNWIEYTQEIEYKEQIYARVINDNYECSIIRITIDKNGNLEVINQETRDVESGILTNAIGDAWEKTWEKNSYLVKRIEDVSNTRKIVKITEDAARVVAETHNSEKNLFNYISEITEDIIYSISKVDGVYAGCYYTDSKTEITYKDINNDIITIYDNIGLKEDKLNNENINIDYAVKQNDNYVYIDNNGNLESNMQIISTFKEYLGNETKYVKIVGDGDTFLVLTKDGEVYKIVKGNDKICKIKSNIIDIKDSCTGININGESVTLQEDVNEEINVVQELEKQTDKYLIATHLGLKNGILYDFSNAREGIEVIKGKIVEVSEEEKENAVAIYSKNDNKIQFFNRDSESKAIIPELKENESYITAEGIDEKLPEFIDIAEYRESFLFATYFEEKDKYTSCIAVTKQGEIYLYINGYAVDTGVNLDYFGPTANYNLSNTNWTNGNINITLSANTRNKIVDSKIKKSETRRGLNSTSINVQNIDNSLEAETNGTYNYFITDSKGRSYTGSINIDNIDKLKPIIPEITQEERKLKVTFKDDQEATEDYGKSGIKLRQYKINDGDWQTALSDEILLDVEENDVVYAKTIDNAGNESDIASGSLNVQIGHITVKYQDIDNGITLKEDAQLSNVIGENYNIEVSEIENYEYKEAEGELSGKYTNEEKIVILKYKVKEAPEPEPEPQEETGKVTVKYQDENGNSLKEDVTLEGKVGEEYSSEKVEFETYDLVEIVGNASGIITKEEQVVIYKYSKKTGKVIIMYVDEKESKLKENDVLEGKIDGSYKATRQIIDEYELVEIVGNEEGKYQLADQFIIYKYKKLEAPITLPQTGQSRIAYIIVGIVILLSICELIYIKLDN